MQPRQPPAIATPSNSSSSMHATAPAKGLAMEVLPARYGICRLQPDAKIPAWALRGSFMSISRSSEELSIVCEEERIPGHLRCERGWRAIKVLGPLDFSLIGVLAAVAGPLAAADVSLFAISTFDTDYILVRDRNLERAIQVLSAVGHRIADAAQVEIVERRQESKEAPGKREAPGKKVRRRDDPRREKEPQGEREPHREKPTRKKRPRPRRDEAVEARDERFDGEEREEPGRRKPRRTARNQATKKKTSKKAPQAEGDVEVSTEQTAASERVGRKRRSKRPVEEQADEPRRGARKRRPERAERPERTERPERSERPERAERPERKERSRRPERKSERPKRERSREDIAESKPKRATKPRKAASDDVAHEARDERGRRGGGEDVDSAGLYTGAIAQPDVETTEDTFADLGLSSPILSTIREIGFVHPTPVQAGVIPDALAGHDIVGLAETGSGKTAAFSLPLADKLTHGRGIRGLILGPTREIALQTQAFLESFGRDHDLDTAVIIGGVRMGPQINALKKKPDILVATPGRLADHLRRGNVRLDKIEKLVLDEADHMLDLGFLPQIQEILEHVPGARQTMMFSATMPPPIERLTRQFMRDPVRVDLRPKGRTAEGIEHRLYLVREEDKKACLIKLLKEVEGTTLVFVRRKIRTEWLSRQLEAAGFGADRIHSDRSQGQRVEALRGFRQGDSEVLVATDVAARGIDVPALSHVINFGAPETVEDYVHRAGRTARGAAKGIVSTITSWQDKQMIKDIEYALGEKLPRCEVEGVEPWKELQRRRKTLRRRLL